MSGEQRRSVQQRLAPRLAALSDTELMALAPDSAAWRGGIGGRSTTIDLDGAKVFVKQINLTAAELAAPGSTANLFDLPTFYQYGVGSAGFSAWRELQAYQRTSGWALAGECPHFALLHHWRVLPRAAPALDAEQEARLARYRDYWGSQAVYARFRAAIEGPATITLFLEHAPQTLADWLDAAVKAGEPAGAALEAAVLSLDQQLRDAAAFMNARGLWHFDLHVWNALTDGARAYVADFGLALSDDFELSPDERAFLDAHRIYDRAYLSWTIVEWLTLPANAAALTPALRRHVARHAKVAAIFRRFMTALRAGPKTTPFPAAGLEAALAAAGV